MEPFCKTAAKARVVWYNAWAPPRIVANLWPLHERFRLQYIVIVTPFSRLVIHQWYICCSGEKARRGIFCVRKVRCSWLYARQKSLKHILKIQGITKRVVTKNHLRPSQFSHWHPHIIHTSSSDLLRHWCHITTGGPITPADYGAIIATRSEGPIIRNDLPVVGWWEANL